ncbi:hypothetical protein L208DRAFT_1424024 [Tricholoma matsutake]|nr:hypothetical protein L208DRAFT_1424024 [Tricholoma matsutake 945]
MDDTSWCPACDKQILPKRLLVSVPPPQPQPPTIPPPPSPIRRSKGGSIRPGLVQGTGRVKPNGSIKPTPPIKLRTVIDQGPTPLYCSDECQSADARDLNPGLPMDYNPASSFSRSDSASDSSVDSQSSLPSYTSKSWSLATIASIYHFPPPPPPLHFDEPASSSDSDVHPPLYTSGVMMAGRRINEYCPKPRRCDSNGHIIPPVEPPKVIPGWNDSTNGWRSAAYSFSSPHTQSGNDVQAYRSFVATSHRSGGVQSTFSSTSSSACSPSDVHSSTSLPVESNEMIHKFSQSFNRRSESRVSLYSSPSRSQSPFPSTSPASQKRERSLLQPGAEGKLLVPDVKMKVHSSSSPSLSSAWSGSRRSSVRSPLSMMSSSSSSGDEDHLTQRCESAVSLPQMQRSQTKRSAVEGRSWSYDNFKTYPVMSLPPKKEKRTEKRLVEGVETEVEVEVEVDAPLKRLFLFPPSSRP